MSNDLKTTKRKWILLSLFLIGVFLIGIGLTYVYLKPKPKQWTYLYQISGETYKEGFREGANLYESGEFTMETEWGLKWYLDSDKTLLLAVHWYMYTDELDEEYWTGWQLLPEDSDYKIEGSKIFQAGRYKIVIVDRDLYKSEWLLQFYEIKEENTT